MFNIKLSWNLNTTKRLHYYTCPNFVNSLRPRQNRRRFADDTFKRIFVNENVRIAIKISLKFVPKGPINNNPALVQIMAWRRSGDKPLSEPMMVSLLTHICVTRPQWVNGCVRHGVPPSNKGWYSDIKVDLCEIKHDLQKWTIRGLMLHAFYDTSYL